MKLRSFRRITIWSTTAWGIRLAWRTAWLWATVLGAALVAARVPDGNITAVVAGAMVLWGDGRWWPPVRDPRLAIPVGAVGFGLVFGPLRSGWVFAAAAVAVLAVVTRLLALSERWAWWQSRLAIRQAWPEVAHHAGWADTTLGKLARTRLGVELPVRWPSGARPPWTAIAPKMSSVVHRPEKQVAVRQGADAGQAIIHIKNPLDAIAKPIPHPPLPDTLPTKLAPIVIGRTEDDMPVALDWQHTLIGGQSGGGKSGVLQTILVSAAGAIAAGKVELWVADPKEGAELGAWADACTVFAEPPPIEDEDTADAAAAELWVEFMRRLHHTMRVRMRQVSDAGRREWTPRMGPFMLVVVDEARDVFAGEASTARAIKLAEKARAAGIVLVAATQHPLKSVIPTELSNNFPQVVGLSAKSATHARVITGDCTEEAPLHKLPPPKRGNAGHMWVRGASGTWERSRAYWVDDTMVAAAATRALGDRQPGDRLAIGSRSSTATEAGPDDTPGDAHVTRARPTVDLASMIADGHPQAGRVFDRIAQAGVEGLAAADGRRATGLGESGWRRTVTALVSAGLVERIDRGRLVRVTEPVEVDLREAV